MTRQASSIQPRNRRLVPGMAMTLVATAAVVLGTTASARAEPPFAGACTAAKLPSLQNGSFERGINPPLDDLRTLYATRSAPNREIEGWIVKPAFANATGSIDWNQRFQASDGERTVDLDGLDSDGAVSQAIAGMVAGHIYIVAFDLAGNPEGPPAIKRVRVDLDGTSSYFTFDTRGTSSEAMGWVTKYVTLRFTGRSSRLTFTSLDPNGPDYDWGAFIDNVKVACVS